MAVSAMPSLATTSAPTSEAASPRPRAAAGGEGSFAAALDRAEVDASPAPKPDSAPDVKDAAVADPAAPEAPAPSPPAPATDAAQPDDAIPLPPLAQVPLPQGSAPAVPAPKDAVSAEESGKPAPAKRKAASADPQVALQTATTTPPPASPIAQPTTAGTLPDSPTHAATEPATHPRTAAATPADLAAASDAAPTQSAPEARLSAPLFTQTLEAATRPVATGAASPYAAQAGDTAVSVREGRFGADIGVTIARALDNGADGAKGDLLIRLAPRHMGRVDVRLSFEHDGMLRAVVSADSSAALDMLRRESADLGRALTDAGVRADAQSLRFDGGGSGGAGSQARQGQRGQAQGPNLDFAGNGSDDPIHRPLRSSGHVDLMA